MRDLAIRSTRIVPPRHATPPPAASGARLARDPRPARALVDRVITIVAIALVLVVAGLLDRIAAPAGANALPLSIVAVAGLGAAAVATTRRRRGVRARTRSPGHRGAAARPSRAATGAPPAHAGADGAPPRARLAVGAWPRLALRTLATLGVAAAMLALVLRSPQSVPLLVGAGLISVLGLRSLAAPTRGRVRV